MLHQFKAQRKISRSKKVNNHVKDSAPVWKFEIGADDKRKEQTSGKCTDAK